MFDHLKPLPADKILMLSTLFRADERDTKIDLGVGVYKDSSGHTPIMRAVKSAEKQLWETENTKTYTSLPGDAGFHKVMADMVLGDSVDRARLACCATPGGTGAIHNVLETVKMASPDTTVWVSNPTWGNHLSILKHLGIAFEAYDYFDADTCAVDFNAMMASLQKVQVGDVVLLHGCCHNPTGANLNQTQWGKVADLLLEKAAIPFIDIAYQGFGDGLDADAYGVHLLASKFPEMMIAASCSKNFGIYRERTGIVLAISADADTAKITQGTLAHMNRQNFSFPPDHGARLVTMVLSDPTLRADWEEELEDVRSGMLVMRQKLADALRTETGSDRFGFITEHRGMFSRLGLSEEQVLTLRNKHAIYMVDDSRINIAGLNETNVPIIAKAVASVIS
ncbi:MAG: amino acid aminotransferase [Rhodobacterales bacterium]